jgi:carboxypeptidase C (cathepsin A)
LNITFNQFSGYIPVGESKQLHYWFYEAESDAANKPLTFWSNGGPGCSGLLGAMTEQGPFRPNKDLKLEMNPYSWNKVSNMVFIEAPAGVGFSYSDNEDDYKTGDDQTANDNYDLIQGFLKRFPEYSKNSLYITSGSYGGHYMPTLAKVIVDQNKAGSQPVLNFKGFAVGNPYTNFYSGTPSGLVTYWGHQLVAKPTWDEYSKKCVETTPSNPKQATECSDLMVVLFEQVGTKINPYALDYPVCVADERGSKGRAQRTWMTSFLLADASPELRRAAGLKSSSHHDLTAENYEPCEDDYTTDYLNQDSVKSALHVKGDIEWGECSYKIRYSIKDKESDMTSYYNYLLDSGADLDILVYSGDDDSVCATEGTQSWIWDLGYKPLSKRDQWTVYDYEGQTAGYFTQFEGKLGFLTIHNAGHEVPTYQPEVALDMFTKYLNGEWTKSK